VRVALDARSVPLPGIGRFILGLWSGLLAIDTDVVGIWPTRSGDEWLMAERPTPPGPVVPSRARPLRVVEQLVLPSTIRGTGADVVHAPHLPVPYATTRPVVLTVHDLFPLRPRSNARSRVAAAYYRVAFPTAVRKARRIVAVSPATAEELMSMLGVPGERIDIVEHGIDDALWHVPSAADVDGVRRRFALDDDFLLYVGTAKPHKNLPLLLGAHTRAHPRLVTVGITREELAGLTDPGDGAVVTLGRVSDDDLRGLSGAATAVVLPSWYEAVGFTALEAMACGTPVISSDGGGLRHTVGDAGVLVDPHDAPGWQRAMSEVAGDADRRDELRARGLARAQSRSWRDAAAAYVELYEAALG
jgi:alpha-1,3-rhamnosyl/mannosyltransferase